jgi:CTP synthase
MLEEGLDTVVLKKFQLAPKHPHDLSDWKTFLSKLQQPKNTVKIGLVGKYVELQDSYKSILEALIHAGTKHLTAVEVVSIHSEHMEESNSQQLLEGVNGVIVAPGFGERGIEGKISAIQYVREQNIPFLGICLGMQMAVIEYARNVKGLSKANSIEMNAKCETPVIDLMESQKNITDKGGTMRLGAWDCSLKKDSKLTEIYQSDAISERHRHRYEFNNAFSEQLFDADFKMAGWNPETQLVEIIENIKHPWFVGVQFHPEYKSTVSNPHPLFAAFVEAALIHNRS